MIVRLLKPWNGNEAETVISLDDGPGQILVETGKAIAAEPTPFITEQLPHGTVLSRPGQKVQPAEVKNKKAKR